MDSIEPSIAPLLHFLLNQANIKRDISTLKMEAMHDGGMGSHKFQTNHLDSKFGSEVANCTFIDSDGVTVSATLNIDQYGDLFELDLFKGDFSNLEKWPLTSELKVT